MKALGIVNLHHVVNLGELTSKRSIASVNFLGRYTFIDFGISNYTNSGIADIVILVKENIRSLLNHLVYGQLNYDVNLKKGGIRILQNEKYVNNPIYNTDINNLLEHISLIEHCNVDNIIFAPVHMLNTLDFRPYLTAHVEKNNEISIIYKKVDNARSEFLNSFVLDHDDGVAKSLSINKGQKDNADIFMEITIIKKQTLLNLLKQAPRISVLFCLRDLINFVMPVITVHALEYQGYLKCFDSERHYLEFSLDLLNEESRNQLFRKDWTIYTRTYDTPPALYEQSAEVSNSYIANGAKIAGKVENSIIGRDVKVGKGADIKNSIILSYSDISENTVLDYVIIDKAVTISKVKSIGDGKNVVTIKEGETI